MKHTQKGAISLFIVIFTTLLVTIVSVSFTQLMIRNQQQVLSSDLSQRAYDSAMAGVEDGKRLLIYQQDVCPGGDHEDANKCEDVTGLINNYGCATIQDSPLASSVVATGNKEVKVGTDRDNQAYTCVKVNPDTKSYKDTLQANTSTVVPLRSQDDFDAIRISWFTDEDSDVAPKDPGATSDKLPIADDWPPGAPPLMRLQYIPGNTTVSNLDDDAKSALLYPQVLPGGTNTTSSASFESKRRTGSFGASTVNCAASYDVRPEGVCQAVLNIPGGDTKSAFLQLSPIYNKAHVTIELIKNGATVVNFHNVQPTVDSTGRADNVFRRVLAHVTVKDGVTMPYPEATINVSDDLCKTFFITDSTRDYNPGACDPDK